MNLPKKIKYAKNVWVMAMAYDVSKRAFDERQKAKRKCKHCGHTQLLGLQDKAICVGVSIIYLKMIELSLCIN